MLFKNECLHIYRKVQIIQKNRQPTSPRKGNVIHLNIIPETSFIYVLAYIACNFYYEWFVSFVFITFMIKILELTKNNGKRKQFCHQDKNHLVFF